MTNFARQSGKDYRQPLSVQRVTVGSVASTALAAGDLILKIANIDSDTLTHNEAQDIIKNTRDVLQLTIEKGGLLTPPEPVVSSQQSLPYKPSKLASNTNFQAMTSSAPQGYNDYDREQTNYNYHQPTQDAYQYQSDSHVYQNQPRQIHVYKNQPAPQTSMNAYSASPDRYGSSYNYQTQQESPYTRQSPQESVSPTRGVYGQSQQSPAFGRPLSPEVSKPQPQFATYNDNSVYGHSSPVAIDPRGSEYQQQTPNYGYRRQTSQDSNSSQGYVRQTSGTSSPNYGRSRALSPTYASNRTMSPTYRENSGAMSPTYGRSHAMSPTYGRPTETPAYGRQMSGGSHENQGYSSPVYQPTSGTQYEAARSQPQPPTWSYGAPLPSDTQPRYTRQTSRENTTPHYATMSQVPDAPHDMPYSSPNDSYHSYYPSTNAHTGQVYQSPSVYNTQDSTHYVNHPDYASIQSQQGGHQDFSSKQSSHFMPRDNSGGYSPTKWEPSTPKFIPPPPPPIEQLHNEPGDYHDHGGSPTHAVPDAVQKQMTKGGPGTKSPFTYAAVSKDDLMKFKQRHKKHQAPPVQMPKKNPPLQRVQDDHPGQKSPPISPGPGTAVISHGQYNSPAGLYSEGNIADAFAGQTGGIIADVKKAPEPSKPPKAHIPPHAYGPIGPNKDFDITKSAAYQMLHGLDEKKQNRPPPRPLPSQPEAEFKPIRNDDEDEDNFRRFLPSSANKQSKSFKLLQRYTKGEEEQEDLNDKSGVYEESNFTGSKESSSTIPSKAFRRLQKFIGANPDEILEEVKQHKPRRRSNTPDDTLNPVRAPIRQQPAEPSKPAPVEQQAPTKSEAEMTPAELRAYRRRQKRQATATAPSKDGADLLEQVSEAKEQKDNGEMKAENDEGVTPGLYKGGNIPSKAFKKLQISMGSLDLNSSGATTRSSRSSNTSSSRSTPSKEILMPKALDRAFPEEKIPKDTVQLDDQDTTSATDDTFTFNITLSENIEETTTHTGGTGNAVDKSTDYNENKEDDTEGSLSEDYVVEVDIVASDKNTDEDSYFATLTPQLIDSETDDKKTCTEVEGMQSGDSADISTVQSDASSAVSGQLKTYRGEDESSQKSSSESANTVISVDTKKEGEGATDF